jgi:hypothetical protein
MYLSHYVLCVVELGVAPAGELGTPGEDTENEVEAALLQAHVPAMSFIHTIVPDESVFDDVKAGVRDKISLREVVELLKKNVKVQMGGGVNCGY